jgi:hypothetical protein
MEYFFDGGVLLSACSREPLYPQASPITITAGGILNVIAKVLPIAEEYHIFKLILQ